MDPSLTPEVAAKSHDRLGFMLCIGLAFHAVVILGVAFDFDIAGSGPSQSQLEITLAQFKQDQAPENADYLAQYNQSGSGSLDEARKITTTEVTDLSSSQIEDVFQHTRQLQSSPESETPLVTTKALSEQAIALTNPDNTDSQSPVDAPQEQELKTSSEIASLEAELDKMRQSYAKLPRVQRMTSVATKASPQAQYLYQWEQRIEFIGNLHYPEEARKQGIYGDLRLMVAIYPNGTLKEVRILKSSGYAMLDDAALNIIRKAAPFPPFPPKLSQETDIIEIIRTWQFRKSFETSS